MSVMLEFCSLIIPVEVIQKYYPGGYKQYKKENSRFFDNGWFDDNLVREGSMGQDFDGMIERWEKLGVKTNKNDPNWDHPCVVAYSDPAILKRLVFHQSSVSLGGKP
jgi:hypothetical protein